MSDEIKLTKNSKGQLCFADSKGKKYKNIKVVRVFPQDETIGYISLLNDKSEEIYLIKDINELKEKYKNLIEIELDKKYFIPEIKKILSIKLESHLAYWYTETDKGKQDFILQVNPENIIKGDEYNYFLTDTYGNKFRIKDIRKLDMKSQKLLETVT